MKRFLRVWRSLITLLLIGSLVTLQGCYFPVTHIPHNIPPAPLSEDIRKQLGVVRVAPTEVKPEDLESAYAKMKRGQSLGVPPPFPPILIGMAVVGIVVGGGILVNELLKGETGREEERVDAETIQKTLVQASIELERTLIEDILHNARESAGHQMLGPNDEPQVSVNSILEIDRLEFGLMEVVHSYHTELTSYAAMRLRVVESTAGRILYSGQVEHLGRTMTSHAWGTRVAEQLRSELGLVSRQLAEKVVDTLFLRYRFREPKLD